MTGIDRCSSVRQVGRSEAWLGLIGPAGVALHRKVEHGQEWTPQHESL